MFQWFGGEHVDHKLQGQHLSYLVRDDPPRGRTGGSAAARPKQQHRPTVPHTETQEPHDAQAQSHKVKTIPQTWQSFPCILIWKNLRSHDKFHVNMMK